MPGKPKRAFSFWPIVAFLLVFPALISLGVWQLQRGQQKAAVYAAFEQGTASVDISGMSLEQLAGLPDYQRVRVSGRYLSGQQFLLDNMPEQGRPGYHVLTPLASSGASWLLVVDRGWLPKDFEGAGLADLSVAGGLREVSGRLAPFPQPGLKLAGGEIPPGWPKLIQFPQADDVASILNAPVAGRMLLLETKAEDGFLRDWQPPGLPPARHYAYAFQWFMLAATLLIIAVVMLLRHRRLESTNE